MEISRTDIERLRSQVLSAAEQAAQYLRATTGHGIDLLRSLKFEQVGMHPLEDRPLNVIEQVNQTFTCLVTLRAAELLFEWYPTIERLRLNVGAVGGSDIESTDDTLAAELFAAVHPRNNRKLIKDIAKVVGRNDVQNRYVFFHSPGFSAGRQHDLETDAADVQVWSVNL